MIEKLVQETVDILERDFYSKKFYFSYSSISKLLYSPAIFHQLYILGNIPEEKEKHLIAGSLIHCLLLEPDKFKDLYIVSPTNLPKDQQRLIVDTVFKKHKRDLKFDNTLEFDDFEETILQVLVDINLHQSLLTDESRIKKIMTPQNISYFEYLKNQEDKIIIDAETYNYCNSALDIILQTPGVQDLIGKTNSKGHNIEVFNELYLQHDIPGFNFGLKGFLDNLVIDHDDKNIYINDFKTTSKTLDDFEESVEFWNYWAQAVIYIALVGYEYPDLIEKGYNIKFCFLVCDKYFNVYPFHLTRKTSEEWFKRFNDLILDVEYHYENNDYTLPAKYAQGRVKL